MDGFLFLIICGLALYFWVRLKRAETRLDDLLALQESTLDYLRGGTVPVSGAAEPAPEEAGAPPEPVEKPRVSVPAVTLRREEDSISAEPELVEDSAPVTRAPEPAEEPNEPEGPRFQIDLEDVFGRRLPIWAGGLTLAIAGVFLVRYSIESGLLTPIVRVVLAFLFGFVLLGAAEFAYRQEERVADPRVRQALAGAGLATLYAAFYLAGTQYGLLGQVAAFLGLAAVTAAAIALSYRFGLPSAILGLVGGFAAPALVGGDEANIPLLALYLGLVTSGLAFTGQRQQRPWLGQAALSGGLGWGVLLLLAGDFGSAEVLAIGAYVIVLGAVLPALAGGQANIRLVRIAAALIASIQLAFLVGQGGYTPLAWGLYLLLGATLAFLAWKRPDMREANAVAALVGLALLATWLDANAELFAVVATGLAAVFAAVPLFHLWKATAVQVDRFQLALVPPVLLIIAYAQFGDFDLATFEPTLAAGSLALALAPAVAAALMLRRGELTWCAAFLGSVGTLVLAALLLVTPAWAAPLCVLAALVPAILLGAKHRHERLHDVAWVGASLGVFLLLSTPLGWEELARLFGSEDTVHTLRAILRWAALGVPFAAMAWLEQRGPGRRLAEALALIAVYGLLAQVLPWQSLAWAAALLGIALHYLMRERIAAQATALGLAFLWALEAFAQWSAATLASLAGDPVFVGDLPTMADTVLQLLPLAAVAFAVNLPLAPRKHTPVRTGWLAVPVLAVAAHILFKQVLAIETLTAFTQAGLAERTIWQGLLLASAWGAWTMRERIADGALVAKILAGASLAYFALYTGLLHNPLWYAQAVGPVPLANLILAAHALAAGAAVFLRDRLGARFAILFDALLMALISVAAIGLLRQVFAGSILTDTPMTQTEDLLRSMVGIVLALLFLFIGSRFGLRSWRVGSLVVMLLAVAKVFIVDAAGLEGLLRIASFLALGFSLIGIGWVYSRQLRGDRITQEDR